MKTSLTTLFTICSLVGLFGQSSVELQLGGSNFLGASVNYGHQFNINNRFSISPKLGLGSMLLPDYGTDMIVHTGLEFRKRRWGLGAEASHFLPNPFLLENLRSEFIALLIYPNINYKITFRNKLYMKFSAGMYLPFDRGVSSNQGTIILPSYDFVDDLIPGAGITLGYQFFRKS